MEKIAFVINNFKINNAVWRKVYDDFKEHDSPHEAAAVHAAWEQLDELGLVRKFQEVFDPVASMPAAEILRYRLLALFAWGDNNVSVDEAYEMMHDRKSSLRYWAVLSYPALVAESLSLE